MIVKRNRNFGKACRTDCTFKHFINLITLMWNSFENTINSISFISRDTNIHKDIDQDSTVCVQQMETLAVFIWL